MCFKLCLKATSTINIGKAIIFYDTYLKCLKESVSIYTNQMTIGEALLKELSRRGFRGKYFTYGESIDLRKSIRARACAFFRKRGIYEIEETDDVARVADELEHFEKSSASKHWAWWLFGDLFLFGIPRLVAVAFRQHRPNDRQDNGDKQAEGNDAH